MQYSATTFAAPVRVTFSTCTSLRSIFSGPSTTPPDAPGQSTTKTTVTPLIERWLYQPAIRAVQVLAAPMRPGNPETSTLYLMYLFLAVLVAYVLY